MYRDRAADPASHTEEGRLRFTRRGLLSVPPLVAVAAMAAARPARANSGTAIECLADLGAF
jgi:hypothetical protein